MRVRHASPDMVQAPSSPSTLIENDMPDETYFEKKLPSPSKQYYNFQTSLTASSQGPARVSEDTPFPPADALKIALEQRRRDTGKHLQKLLDDGRRRAIQRLMNKPGAWRNILERRLRRRSRLSLGLGRSIVQIRDRQGLSSRPGGRKITPLTDSKSLEKKGAVDKFNTSGAGDWYVAAGLTGVDRGSAGEERQYGRQHVPQCQWPSPQETHPEIPFQISLERQAPVAGRPSRKQCGRQGVAQSQGTSPQDTHRKTSSHSSPRRQAPITRIRSRRGRERERDGWYNSGNESTEEAPPSGSSCTEEGAKT